MNENQKMKMELLKEFGITDEKSSVDFCREAYKFLTEEDGKKVYPSVTEVQAIDLGLPSGTLWCDRNVGAKSPEDYGAFFSWGNTIPHYPSRKNMDWGDDDEAFDYSFDSDNYEETEGYKLESDIDLAHDAARINMGEPWQMPTSEQFKELYDNCTRVRKTVNGVNGYLVTSKINGNSIFMPCSGYGNGTSWYSRGSDGYYWSGSLFSATYGRHLYFYSGGVYPQSSSYRFDGIAVRAVQTSFTK